MDSFPIVRRPAPGTGTPVLVSVPHYGTQALPDITRDDYTEPWFETFAYGFADTFVGDLYADLHEHGATVLATPFSRMFVDVNRRRDDFEHQDGEVRSRRGVVRTHTMRDVPIFARPLGLADLEARLQTLYDPYYATLERLLAELHQAFGYALVLDGHTGSPRRMKRSPGDHRNAPRCHVRARAGRDGGRGLHPSRLRGPPERQRVHRRQHRGHLRPAPHAGHSRAPAGGQRVAADDDQPRGVHRPGVARRHPREGGSEIARVRACLREAVESLATVLAGGHGSPR